MGCNLPVLSKLLLLLSVTQLCPALCTPMGCSAPGSSVRGVFSQEHCSGLHFALRGSSRPIGAEAVPPTLTGGFLTTELPGRPSPKSTRRINCRFLTRSSRARTVGVGALILVTNSCKLKFKEDTGSHQNQSSLQFHYFRTSSGAFTARTLKSIKAKNNRPHSFEIISSRVRGGKHNKGSCELLEQHYFTLLFTGP